MRKSLACLFVLVCQCLGCAAWQGPVDSSVPAVPQTVNEQGGADGLAQKKQSHAQALAQLRSPQIPAVLCGVARERAGEHSVPGERVAKTASANLTTNPQQSMGAGLVPYTVDFKIRGTRAPQAMTSPSVQAPDGSEAILDLLREQSLLVRLADKPPVSISGLERRALADVGEARRILQSQGFYDGRVRYHLDSGLSPVRVEISLLTGPQFHLGTSRIQLRGTADTRSVQEHIRTLTDVGLAPGAPALAGDILAAVDRIPEYLKRNGYPFARVLGSRYVLDRATRTLDAEIDVQTGTHAFMGGVEIEGAKEVNPEYLKTMRTWQLGKAWNQNRIDAYQEELRQTGLFSSVQLEPLAGMGDASILPVLVRVTEAPQKTVGGGLKYSTDMGAGLNGYWENRNVFGEGETLRVELPFWEKRQEGRVIFRKPHYGQKNQNLLAEAWARNEDSDAYKQKAVWSAAGIERRLSRDWWGSVRASIEGGQLNEHRKPASSYAMFGVPLGLRYDGTDSLLDPTQGLRLNLAGSPYTGEYRKNFTVIRTRVDASGYYPVLDKRLVFAGRISSGGISGSPVASIPNSIRFYGGGGGSVRGYAYQSLGPRDGDDRPEGGASFLETSMELRFKITESIGLVPFLDGGNVFTSSSPDWGGDLRWGTGIGLRYYTSIGSLRCDVATPLDPRHDDAPLQVYLSIGQSF